MQEGSSARHQAIHPKHGRKRITSRSCRTVGRGGCTSVVKPAVEISGGGRERWGGERGHVSNVIGKRCCAWTEPQKHQGQTFQPPAGESGTDQGSGRYFVLRRIACGLICDSQVEWCALAAQNGGGVAHIRVWGFQIRRNVQNLYSSSIFTLPMITADFIHI